ncbi:MAG TPA: YggS family pyridoxal phosphate-dependent enzyme [Puia sp.]|nr:YggS family pyridoxal phosphate-dependent enzyme [Puia sp.]
MAVNPEEYKEVLAELNGHAQLVAVSKTKPAEEIRALYELGQRDFGENYVQELVDKQAQLPADIRWHFIGHLQSNKVKYIAPFVHLIHGVDSFKLLKEIDKQAAKNGRSIDVLLQVHIAREETKFGLDAGELEEIMPEELKNVRIRGLMGMASFVHDTDPEKVREEFRGLKALFDKYFQGPGQLADLASPGGVSGGPWLSMGMSSDYKMAIEEGSNMVRIGSLLFGKRT